MTGGDSVADERVVKVRLIAETQQALAEFDKVRKGVQDTAAAGVDATRAFEMLGRGMVAAGGLIAVGLGVAISKFAEFDQAMSYVQAATHETAENMELLRQAALDAGASTVFSATESANAIEELSKAGLSTADILGGALTGSLDLAAAGGLGVARAAEISATALQQFGLEGSEAVHVADVLAAGAGKAMGSVEDLANGLKFVGPIAASMGVSIEETAGTLALFAQQGIIGEQAGTSLRGMLSSLTSPSSQARKEIERLGITLYDADGNFRGLEAAAGELSKAYSGMTGEARDASLGVIFGNQQITAATALYQAGAEGVREWTEAVDDQGYAAETAAIRLDNLTGDVEAFQGALDTAFISMGEAANGPGRFFVQLLTDMVDGFNKLPEGSKQAVFWIGAIGAAVALTGGAYLLAVPKIAAYNAALATLGPTAQRASRIVGGLAKGVGLIAGLGLAANVMTRLAGASAKAAPGIDLVLKSLNEGQMDGAFANASKGADSFAESLELIAGSGFDASMERFGETLGGAFGITGQVTEARAGFEALDSAMSQMVSGGNSAKAAGWFDELTKAAEAQGIPIEKLKELFPQYENALAAAEDGTGEAAVAIDLLAQEAEIAESNLSDLEDALREIAGTAMGMGAAMDDAQGAVNRLDEAAKAEGATLLGTNDASIALRDSIREVEEAHRDSAVAILENGGSLQDARAEWEKGREAVIQMRISMGESREEAELWADENLGAAEEVEGALNDVRDAVVGIPDRKTIAVEANTWPAANAIDRLVRTYNGTTLRMNVVTDSFYIPSNYAGNLYDKGVQQFAAGGFPSGIYAGRLGGIHKFAESEMGVPWETYISGRAADRERNVGIWMETGRRLGVTETRSAAVPPTSGLRDGDRLVLVVEGTPLTAVVQRHTQAAGVSTQLSVMQGVR